MNSASPVDTLIGLCRADLIGRRVEWMPVDEELVQSAVSHGLVGLLHRALAGVEHLPMDLRHAAIAHASANIALSAELISIVRALKDADVDSIALKGPALAGRAYGHIYVRDSSDLDILVRREDLARAKTILTKLGYRRKESADETYHLTFVRQDDESVVEIHWALTSEMERVRIDADGIWARTEEVLVQGEPVRTLGLEDTILYLCIHGFKHRWNCLKWVSDVAYLLHRETSMNWEALLERARQCGCLRILRIGLLLVSTTFRIALPPNIEAEARADRTAVRLIGKFARALTGGTAIGEIEAMIYEIHARERFPDRAALLWRLIDHIVRPTSEDGPMTSSILVLALKRPFRLCRTYGFGWLRPMFRLR